MAANNNDEMQAYMNHVYPAPNAIATDGDRCEATTLTFMQDDERRVVHFQFEKSSDASAVMTASVNIRSLGLDKYHPDCKKIIVSATILDAHGIHTNLCAATFSLERTVNETAAGANDDDEDDDAPAQPKTAIAQVRQTREVSQPLSISPATIVSSTGATCDAIVDFNSWAALAPQAPFFKLNEDDFKGLRYAVDLDVPAKQRLAKQTVIALPVGFEGTSKPGTRANPVAWLAETLIPSDKSVQIREKASVYYPNHESVLDVDAPVKSITMQKDVYLWAQKTAARMGALVASDLREWHRISCKLTPLDIESLRADQEYAAAHPTRPLALVVEFIVRYADSVEKDTWEKWCIGMPFKTRALKGASA